MNIAVTGAAALEADLKVLGADLASVMKRALKLEGDTIRFVESLGHDVAQIGDALGYFGAVHAGLGAAARGMQGLHAAAHEASKRLLSPAEERSGPGDKTPPPKP